MQESVILYDAFAEFIQRPLNWVMAGSVFIVFCVLRSMLLSAAGFRSIQGSLYFSLIAGILSFTGAGVMLYLRLPLHPLLIATLGMVVGAMWLFETLLMIFTYPRSSWVDGILGNTLSFLVLATAGLTTYIFTSFPIPGI
jgi:hypothetical protein